MTPWPVTVAIIAPIAGRLADRYPAGILGGIGLGVLSLGFILLGIAPGQAERCEPSLGESSSAACGFGFFQSPNNRAIVSSAPRERSGGAGAIQATARLLGQTIGAALVALVFGYAGPGRRHQPDHGDPDRRRLFGACRARQPVPPAQFRARSDARFPFADSDIRIRTAIEFPVRSPP